MVDFVPQYTGTTFFLDGKTRMGWVPVHPVTATWYTPSRTPGQYNDHTHTMFSLRLAWALTIWKTLCQTIIGKVNLCQGRVEKEHDLTYVALSRVTKFSDIGLHDNITKTDCVDQFQIIKR
eukprot:8659764-Ditylum_brightwellii.AAC.1